MKAVGRSELTPIAHWVTHIATRDICARFGRDDPVALDPESIRARSLVLLLGINGEVSLRRGLGRNPDGGGDRHQDAIAFHHVNVLLRERNLYSHRGWIVRAMRRDPIIAGRNRGGRCAAARQE